MLLDSSKVEGSLELQVFLAFTRPLRLSTYSKPLVRAMRLALCTIYVPLRSLPDVVQRPSKSIVTYSRAIGFEEAHVSLLMVKRYVIIFPKKERCFYKVEVNQSPAPVSLLTTKSTMCRYILITSK